ncbi:MAG: hypothetical protein ACLPSF_08285 [Methylocella sp.]
MYRAMGFDPYPSFAGWGSQFGPSPRSSTVRAVAAKGGARKKIFKEKRGVRFLDLVKTRESPDRNRARGRFSRRYDKNFFIYQPVRLIF